MPKPRNPENLHLPKNVYRGRSGYHLIKPYLRLCGPDATIEEIKASLQLIDDGTGFPTKNQILHISKPVSLCGIYFLIKNKEIVYVGKSTNIRSRIVNHYFSKKDFDRISVIELDKSRLDSYEKHYIKSLRPKFNTLGVTICER